MSETYSEGKQDKAAVGYSEAKLDADGNGDACGRCDNYRPKMWRTSGWCTEVEGPVNGRYWCRLFEARRG